jgi:hypothetical protein
MPRLHHAARLSAAAALVIALAGCGGANAPVPGGPAQPGPQPGATHRFPAPVTGLQLPIAPPADIDFASDDKGTSAVYRILYRDAVNQSSGPRWSVANNSGGKSWTLSNTFFSAPKAWVLGQNYWNVEDDTLTSTGFAVQDGEDGLALTFMARWNILPGDHGTVFYSEGLIDTQVVDFTAGTNPSYPNYDKYYFKLPANTSGLAQQCGVTFAFSSDAAGTSWGFGVDNVAVYQTQLGTPLGLIATEGDFLGQVDLDWDHVQVGNLLPDGYDIFRADDVNGAPGVYAFHDSTLHPSSFYSDLTGDGSTYWYKVVATKAGWPNSGETNEDSGWGIGTWVNGIVDADDALYTSLAEVDGKPAIAYYDQPNGDLRYAYSSTADGNGVWTEVLVDDGGASDVGQMPSLLSVNGFPAISYFDDTDDDLKYAISSTVDGSAGWTSFGIETGIGSVGSSSSLFIVNGNPAISYADGLADLKYAYSSTVDGAMAGDWILLTIEGPGPPLTAQGTSLKVINGFPAIAHGDNTTPGVRYEYSNTADGSAGWSFVVVDNLNGQGDYAKLAEVNGFPSLAYQSQSLGTLHFAYSSMADGSSGWNNLQVDANGSYIGLNVFHGTPLLAYYYQPTGDLRVATTLLPDGSAGWVPDIIDGAAGNVGEYASLAMINGKPAVSYRDSTNGDLKFAWYE